MLPGNSPAVAMQLLAVLATLCQCEMEMLVWTAKVPCGDGVMRPAEASGVCMLLVGRFWVEGACPHCHMGKASMPTVRSVLHFEVPWLSCQLKICVRQWRI